MSREGAIQAAGGGVLDEASSFVPSDSSVLQALRSIEGPQECRRRELRPGGRNGSKAADFR